MSRMVVTRAMEGGCSRPCPTRTTTLRFVDHYRAPDSTDSVDNDLTAIIDVSPSHEDEDGVQLIPLISRLTLYIVL